MLYFNLFQHFACEQYSNKNGTINNYTSLPRPFHNLFLLENGEVEITSSAGSFTVKANQLAFIPRGYCYCSKWVGSNTVRFKTVHFVFQPQNDPFKTLSTAACVFKTELPLLQLFLSIYQSQQQNSKQAAVLGSFFTLLQPVLNGLPQQAKSAKASQIFPALEFLKTNYQKPVKIAKLAACCCLSESRFYSLFKAETGQTPIAYKNRLMLEQALCTLTLNPGCSIEKAAADCGFNSSEYFRRLFKKVYGKTPGEYLAEKNGL